MNHYPHHLGDYAKDTAHLTLVEHGAYGQLMRRYYGTEQPLPRELADVYRLAGARTSPEKEAVRNVLRDFFTLEDDGYHQKRIDAEISAYREKAEKASQSASRRWGKPVNNALPPASEGNANASPAHDERSPKAMLASSHKPITNNPVKHSMDARNIPAPEDRVAALTAICAAKRIETTPGKSLGHLRQFAAEGVTDEQLADAIAIAEDRLQGGIVRVAYLAPIVVDLRAGRIHREAPRGKDAIAGAIAAIAARDANATH